jgi:hypothetical protein
MSIVLVLIFFWSLFFGFYHWHVAIKTVIASELSTFIKSVGNALPYSVIWIDAFLRLFSVTHTGLW